MVHGFLFGTVDIDECAEFRSPAEYCSPRWICIQKRCVVRSMG